METHIISNFQDFNLLKNYASENTSLTDFVLDTETDNKVEKLAKLYGIGVCFTDKEAFYIPIRRKDTTKWWTYAEEEAIKSWINFHATTKRLLGHNILYDVLILLYNWDINLTDYIYSDTILQKHTLDEERPHGLKETAVKYLGSWADKAQKDLYDNIKKNGGKTTKDNTEMYKADTLVLGEYCCWDVLLTKKLFDIFEPRIHSENLADLFYKDEIMPLYKEVTIPMKIQGFPIDVDYFKELNRTINGEIDNLQHSLQKEIEPLVRDYVQKDIQEQYPIKASGNFPKHVANLISFSLPKNKEGGITLAKKEIDKILEPQLENHRNFLAWLKGTEELDKDLAYEAQMSWWRSCHEGAQYVFNLGSNDDLAHLFVECLHEEPLSFTEKLKNPQIDDDFLESIKERHSWVQSLIDYKKLMKLKSTYIEGILEHQIEGKIHTSMIQFGPPSGRYASKNPNLQNLPRIKEDDSGLSELVLKYVNSIKKGFIAKEGDVIVNADYSQLEPRAFAEACGDLLLQQVFIKGEDLYASIAKGIWNLDCPVKEVKSKYPEYRQKAKVIALAVVYGAEAGRISKLMNIEYKEAETIIEDYLDAYPKLRTYMSQCNKEACQNGHVATKFGRIRHLPAAKGYYERYGLKLLDKRWAKTQGLEEESWKFKNLLNLAKNYKIQGVASHTVNRAAIAISKEFKKYKLNANIVMQVHDELTTISSKEHSLQVKEIVKRCMENTVKLSVPLIAEPIIAQNWAEAK